MEPISLRLGGRRWEVPALTIAQLRHVVPALLRLGGVAATALGEGAFDDLVTVVHWGLKRAEPTLSRDEVLALEAAPGELLAAAALIARQTGMAEAPAGGGPPPGE